MEGQLFKSAPVWFYLIIYLPISPVFREAIIFTSFFQVLTAGTSAGSSSSAEASQKLKNLLADLSRSEKRCKHVELDARTLRTENGTIKSQNAVLQKQNAEMKRVMATLEGAVTDLQVGLCFF